MTGRRLTPGNGCQQCDLAVVRGRHGMKQKRQHQERGQALDDRRTGIGRAADEETRPNLAWTLRQNLDLVVKLVVKHVDASMPTRMHPRP